MAKSNRKKVTKAKEEKEEMDGLQLPFVQAMKFLVQEPDNKPSETLPNKGKDKDK